MSEITKEQMSKLICSRPVEQGGLPKWMFEDSYMSIIESLEKRLAFFGVRIAYIREDKL